jgi:hypothetical protein
MSLNSISSKAFQDCSQLNIIRIYSKSFSTFEDYSFSGCRSIKTIEFPKGYCPTDINIIAFDSDIYSQIFSSGSSECNTFKPDDTSHLIINENVFHIPDYEYFKMKNIVTVSFPETLFTIGNSSFEGCSNLINISIPSLVISIGNRAFFGCSQLSNVIIDSQVEFISDLVLRGLTTLHNISLPIYLKTIGDKAFSD